MAFTSVEYFNIVKRQLRESSPDLQEPDLSRIAAQLASTEILADSVDRLTKQLEEPLTLTFMWDRADGELTGSFNVKIVD